MMNMRNRLLLILIVCIAFFLRVYKIPTIPPSLSWDEVSIGYNAYSLLKTGRDEHGRFLPLDTFIAYGDYKPPIPVYVTIPFVAVLGMSELSVRLPVAIFGTISVLLTYILVLLLFQDYKHKSSLALVSAMLLAISPWHINLSRVGFEAVIALCFVISSAVLFLKAREKKPFFYIAFIPLVLAIYTFNSARYFAPFFALLMTWSVRQQVMKAKKEIGIGIFLACILMMPIIPHLLSPEARLRFKEVNIFSDVQLVELANTRMERAGNTFLAKIIHNRRVYYALAFFKHYLDHFDPKFLFIQGDGNPKFSIQDVGQLYLIEAPLLIIGLLALLSYHQKEGIQLLLWVVLAIVPAATARETPHALRILNTLPVWQIYIAYGIVTLSNATKNKFFKMGVKGILMSYLILVSYYLHTYYIHYPIEYSGEWQYGYREVINYAESVKDNYKQIVLTDYIGRPYAYTLFYSSYDPHEYLKTKRSSFDAAGFYNVSGFGKYEFIRSNPPFETNILYFLPAGSVPQGATEVFHVNLLNGTPAIVGFHL